MRLQKNLILLCMLCIVVDNYALFSQEKLHVVTEELAPLNYSENGVVLGTATDIMRKVMVEAKMSYEIVIYPWARAYSMALHDENTLIYSLNRTSDRENSFYWIGRVSDKKNDACLYALSDNAYIVPAKDDLYRNYRVAVVNKDINHDYLLHAGYSNISITHSLESCIKMLFTRRVDLIVSTDEIMKIELEKMDKSYESVKRLGVLRASDPYLAASHKTQKSIVLHLIKSYDALLIKGEIPDFSK